MVVVPLIQHFPVILMATGMLTEMIWPYLPNIFEQVSLVLPILTAQPIIFVKKRWETVKVREHVDPKAVEFVRMFGSLFAGVMDKPTVIPARLLLAV